MNRLLFDENYKICDFTILLATRSHEHLGALENIDSSSIIYRANLNSADELSFKLYKELDGKKERLWDDLVDLKLVWVKELNEYFEIKINLDDSSDIIKSVTAASLCEAELGQTMLYGMEINTEADILRPDYAVTRFYDRDNPKCSLLHRVLDKTPHYSIKYVAPSLSSIQRSFHIDGTSVYDFLTGECAQQFHCLFEFDSADRSVSVYDLYTVCNDCGHRGEFNDICPVCGSGSLTYFGEDTAIYVDKENLTDAVSFETDVDRIKNCFKLEAGDDLMTATVRALNQNGSGYIYYLSEEQRRDMPSELVEKLEAYDTLYASYTEEYQALMEDLYECIDNILYYTSEMMPTIEHAEVTASTEAARLTAAHLSPLALSRVTDSTYASTVDSAIRNYARVYVRTGYVKLEVNESSFRYVGTDSAGYSYGTWTGNFKVTNYSDENDVVISDLITVKVYDNYEDFIGQKIRKSIAADNDEDGSVFDVLSMSDPDSFRDALKLYCLNRLTSFYDAIQGAMDVLIQADQAGNGADLYETMYVPYYNKLQACQEEIDLRQAAIDEWQHTYDGLEVRKHEIQSDLNLADYLGAELYAIFCSYRREDTYSNSNYISDGLNNSELFRKAQEFIDTARKELYTSGERQHSISTTLFNLLLMPEFRPLTEKFQLGNFIRVGVDDTVYRLRLTGYTVNFSSLHNLEVEFSDMTRIHDGVSDMQSILSSAQSMAKSYDCVSKQAEKGNEAQGNIRKWVSDGLNSALIQIKNNEHEEITYGKFGLNAKEYDDITDSYSDEQLRITHNSIVMTQDNWKSASLAIGRHPYTYYDKNSNGFKKDTGYGVSADFLQSAYVYGSQIIGGDIYSDNYSSASGTYINLHDGTFSFAGGKLTYNGKQLAIEGEINATTSGKIGCWNINNTSIYRNSGSFGNAAGMYFGTEGLSLGNAFKVTPNGTASMTNANINGTVTTSALTATGGTIGGASLNDAGIYFNNNNTGWGLWGTTAHANIAFHAGGNTAGIGTAPFRVYHDGSVVANSLTATGGTFDHVTINDTCTVNGQSITGTIGNNVSWKGDYIGGDYIGSGIKAGNITSGTLTRPVTVSEDVYVNSSGITANTASNNFNTLGVTTLKPNIPYTSASGSDIGTSSSKFRYVYAASFIGTLSENSSRELKTNIADVTSAYCLQSVLDTEIKSYNYKDDVKDVTCDLENLEKEKEEYLSSLNDSLTEEQTKMIESFDERIECIKNYHMIIPEKRYGFIAEDAPKDIVSKDRKTVDIYSSIAMAYGGIQELYKLVDEQRKEIASMKGV